MGGIFRRFSKHLRSGLPLPTTYDPDLHYNCFIEAAVPPELQQECYCELRRRGKIWASHYLPDGRLQLMVSDLGAGLDACRAVIDTAIQNELKSAELVRRLKQDWVELSSASRDGITLLVYLEPEPLQIINLDRVIRTINETIKDMKAKDEPHTVFRTTVSRLQENKAHLPLEASLLYRSRVGNYWHYVFVDDVDELYVYGQNDRKVLLPYCVDESGHITLAGACSIRSKWFRSEHELTERERSDITMVYRYKPYTETVEALCTRFQTHPG